MAMKIRDRSSELGPVLSQTCRILHLSEISRYDTVKNCIMARKREISSLSTYSLKTMRVLIYCLTLFPNIFISF